MLESHHLPLGKLPPIQWRLRVRHTTKDGSMQAISRYNVRHGEVNQQELHKALSQLVQMGDIAHHWAFASCFYVSCHPLNPLLQLMCPIEK